MVLHFNSHPLGAKLVDTFRLPHEHDLKLGPLRVVVDELCQLLVNLVFLNWDVDGNPLLQVDHVLLEGLDLPLGILELLEQLQRSLVGLVHLLLELKDVVRGALQLVLKLRSGLLTVVLPDESFFELGLDISLLGQFLLEGNDDARLLQDGGLLLLDGSRLLIEQRLE